MAEALTIQTGGRALDSPRSIDELRERRALMTAFIREAMVAGRDYGVIPGTGKKPALLQPGAEKLCTLFRFSTETRVVEKVEDFGGDQHGGEPFFIYVATCVVTQNGVPIATREASCNSWEVKYRWREQKPICPVCGVEAVNRSRDNEGEYYCWRKIGGCGGVFKAGSPHALAIAAMPSGRVPNSEIYDQLNTLSQMAQKRAMISAVKAACDASEYFTTPDAPGAPAEAGSSQSTQVETQAPQQQHSAVSTGERYKCANCGTNDPERHGPQCRQDAAATAPAATQSAQTVPDGQAPAPANPPAEPDPFDLHGIAFARDVASMFGLTITKHDEPWLTRLNDDAALEMIPGKGLSPEQWERCFAGMKAVADCAEDDADREALKVSANWLRICEEVSKIRHGSVKDISGSEWCAIASHLVTRKG